MTGKRIILLTLFAVAALALALSVRGSAEAQTYKPFNTYSVTNTTPGNNSNSLVGFSIAAPDYNYEDASMTILQPGDAVTANGLEAPIGAYAASLTASVAVGLLGGPCNSALNPTFNLKNSSVDIADVDNDTSWILKPTSATIPDSDGDGLKDYEEKYPSFLNDMLDPDGSGPLLPLQPRARLAGHTSVAGNWVFVQFLIFNPGQMTAMGGIYAQMTAEKGAPNLVVLDNPKQTQGGNSPGAIADFCTPLKTTTTLYGVTLDNPASVPNEAGFNRQANAAGGTGIALTGTHMATNYSQSERDIDNDGFENDLDGCRYTPDLATWNPRTSACVRGSNPGDQDCDMLPSSCDPNDAVNNTDQDADGYDNAQDNCPMVANGCKDGTCGPIFNAAWDNQEDSDSGLTNTDLGPRTDSLGDACDDSDDDGNEGGAGVGTCNDGIDNNANTLTDGADASCKPNMDSVDVPTRGVPPNPHDGNYYHGMPWAAACVGGVDADGDGYCAALEALLGSSDANGPETGAQCTNAIDDDGDTYINDGCPRVGKYSETGAECLNAVSDDTPTPDVAAWEVTVTVNDGCPTIGTPESLVISATITAGAIAQPVQTAPQSCSDGVDNDGDGTTDAADNTALGCAAAAYAGDADKDGVLDGSDNCPAAWNPTQTNTDLGFAATTAFPAGDSLGDACDTDDDADGFTDAIEGTLPTDPLDRCRNGAGATRSDAWGLDQDLNASVTVVGDVLKYSGKIGASVSGTPPTSWALSRLDLDGNRSITVVGDVLKYSGKIGGSCT
jgi:hypothetical protein